jgi:hypothetical protein
MERDKDTAGPDPVGETPFAEKRVRLDEGPNEVGAKDVAGEYQATREPFRGTEVEDVEHLGGRARVPGEVRPYQQEPVDVASQSRMPPKYSP